VLVNNQKLKGYILLRYININKGILFKDPTIIKEMVYYEPIISSSNLIYENGRSEVRIRGM
jgi:hypothetical protein